MDQLTSIPAKTKPLQPSTEHLCCCYFLHVQRGLHPVQIRCTCVMLDLSNQKIQLLHMSMHTSRGDLTDSSDTNDALGCAHETPEFHHMEHHECCDCRWLARPSSLARPLQWSLCSLSLTLVRIHSAPCSCSVELQRNSSLQHDLFPTCNILRHEIFCEMIVIQQAHYPTVCELRRCYALKWDSDIIYFYYLAYCQL